MADGSKSDETGESGGPNSPWPLKLITSVQLKLIAPVRESYVLKFGVSLLIIVLLISSVGLVVQNSVARTLNEDVKKQLTLEAESEAKQMSDWLESNRHPTRITADHPALNGDRDTMTRYLQNRMSQLPDRVIAAHVVKTNKETIVASSNEDRIGDSVANTPWIRQTSFRGFDDVIVSRPYRRDDQFVVGFVSPTIQQPRQILVLIVDTRAIKFEAAIEGTFTSVVRKTYGSPRVLFSDSPYQEKRPRPYIAGRDEFPQLEAALEGQTVFVKRANKSATLDRRYVAAYTPVRGSDWVVIHHAPTENAYQLREDIRQAFVAFAVLALLGVLVVGGTIGRNTARAVQTLSETARDIENGQYDIELQTRRRDEIGQLYNSIDGMRTSIRQHIDRVERRNEQLQVLDRLLRHNLHNELNIVQLNAEIIRDGHTTTPQEDARTIVRKSEGLIAKAEKQRIITKVLAAESEQSTIDLVQTVQNIQYELQNEYPGAQIRFDHPETVFVSANPYVETAIKELVENAVVHNDQETPTVELQITRNDTQTEIQITDNGPQIPQSDRHILLGEHESDPLNHGSGIGHWVVYWVIHVSGGTIAYEGNIPRGNILVLTLESTDKPADTDT